jgi:hypothetical protein
MLLVVLVLVLVVLWFLRLLMVLLRGLAVDRDRGRGVYRSSDRGICVLGCRCPSWFL